MPRRTCSVCQLDVQMRDYIEKAISERGMEYRKLALEVKISKSSLHRHMCSCWAKMKFYNRAFPQARAEGRLIVQWGTDSDYWFGGEPTELRANDMVIVVVHESPPTRNTGRFAEEADTEEFADDESAEGPGEAKNNPDNVSVVSQPEPPPPPAEPAPLCEHQWTTPAAGIRRCIACGTQQDQFQVPGVSRKWLQDKQRTPFRSFRSFGRFG